MVLVISCKSIVAKPKNQKIISLKGTFSVYGVFFLGIFNAAFPTSSRDQICGKFSTKIVPGYACGDFRYWNKHLKWPLNIFLKIMILGIFFKFGPFILKNFSVNNEEDIFWNFVLDFYELIQVKWNKTGSNHHTP